MRAGLDLNELIADGLARSHWLIVLCSPRSAASRYVRREIVQFKLQGKSERILPVIIEGEPGACFPRTLRRGVPVENKKDASWTRADRLARKARAAGCRPAAGGHVRARLYQRGRVSCGSSKGATRCCRSRSG